MRQRCEFPFLISTEERRKKKKKKEEEKKREKCQKARKSQNE